MSGTFRRFSSTDSRFSEPWTWKGRVTISVADCIETICEKATFVEFTEAEPPHFASFVHSKRDLIFDALFDVDDIVIFLQHCQPPHQFARLTAEGPDAESLCIFSDYMAKKGQVGQSLIVYIKLLKNAT